jgi:hypothetical protein
VGEDLGLTPSYRNRTHQSRVLNWRTGTASDGGTVSKFCI